MILSQYKAPNRHQWLDSLRGISAILVLILHIWLIIKNYVPEGLSKQVVSSLVFGITDFGKIGVVIFFFISGYLIPTSLLRKKTIEFLKGRFYRLYPAYWFSIILFVITTRSIDIPLIIVNMTMFQKFVGFPDLIGVFWTLQIEWVFYIICIIFLHVGLFRKQVFVYLSPFLFILISIIISFLRYYTNQKLPVALFLALSVMFIAMLLRFSEEKKSPERDVSSKILIVFIILLLPITVLAYNKDYGYQETWYRYYLSYLVATFIFFLFYKYHFFSTTTAFLGKISYSLYLLHPICIDLTNKYCYSLKEGNLSFFIIICVFSSIILSTLSYRFIEQRFIFTK